MKKVSLTIYMEPVQAKDLRRLVEATGIPMAVLIRRGIDEILRREGEKGNLPGYERSLFSDLKSD